MKWKDVLFRFKIIKLVLYTIVIIIIIFSINQHQQKVNQGLQECGLPQKYEISF